MTNTTCKCPLRERGIHVTGCSAPASQAPVRLLRTFAKIDPQGRVVAMGPGTQLGSDRMAIATARMDGFKLIEVALVDLTDVNNGPLIEIALQIIEEVRQYAVGKHEPGTWLAEGLEHHIQHAYDHIKRYLAEGKEVDLTHLMVRSTMAIWSERNNVHTQIFEPDQTILLTEEEATT